jgi:hypothetical protein
MLLLFIYILRGILQIKFNSKTKVIISVVSKFYSLKKYFAFTGVLVCNIINMNMQSICHVNTSQ